ncbi:MAG: phage terminase large subunit family protein [Pirellulales bacterium]|nr:phage terminase large subunit family protein [Pirellulales bacterium]
MFNIPWSDDHLKVIDKIERAVLAGGLFALAMPRGSGKTTLCEISALWAILYGHRKFICMIGASEDAAAQMVDSIKAEIEVNELLAADFPEVCYPIEKLDGIVNRTSGQLYKGKRTHITWTAKEIVLPSIPKSTASGAIVKCAGITGRIRGMKFKRPDGKSVRPDFVICDDPQTDESARSPSQCVTRETILATAILGLAGPGQKMSGIMPCTIIRDNDMAMRMLDREKHPEWQGELTKMVYKWPDATNLWDEYAERRAEELRSDGDGSQATAFYADNREEMDKGAIVSWYDRFNEDELSAIQHAYNLRIRDESAFFSEYQNAPVVDSEQSDILTTDEIAEKVNGLKRGEVPGDVDKLTCFIDIQQKVLFYTVVGFAPNFSGYVIDYGIYPDQKLRYFTLREVRTTLQQKKRGAGLEGAIFHGLETLTDKLHDTIYTRDDGAELLLDLTLIDANWGLTTDLVHQFCRNTKHRGKIMPAHGRYVGAASRPFNEYSRKKGERIGYNWRIPTVKGKRVVRHLLFDSNFWKSFLHARFAQPFGDAGSLTLFKAKPSVHQMIADQCCAEYRIRTAGRGRTVDEWRLPPNKPDNHFLDCLAGSCVAASVLGVKLSGLRMTPTKRDSDDVEDPKKYKRKRVTYLE